MIAANGNKKCIAWINACAAARYGEEDAAWATWVVAWAASLDITRESQAEYLRANYKPTFKKEDHGKRC